MRMTRLRMNESHDLVSKHVHYKAPMYNGLVVAIDEALRNVDRTAYLEALNEVEMLVLDIQEKTPFGNPKSADHALAEVLEICKNLKKEMESQNERK